MPPIFRSPLNADATQQNNQDDGTFEEIGLKKFPVCYHLQHGNLLTTLSSFHVQGNVVTHNFKTQDLLAEYLHENPNAEGEDCNRDMERLQPRYFLRSMKGKRAETQEQTAQQRPPRSLKLTPREQKYVDTTGALIQSDGGWVCVSYVYEFQCALIKFKRIHWDRGFSSTGWWPRNGNHGIHFCKGSELFTSSANTENSPQFTKEGTRHPPHIPKRKRSGCKQI